MRKIAFLFPGQGSQYVGMGKEFYKVYREAKEIFQQANEILGFDIKRLCFEGPEEELENTINTQPAIFIVNWIITEVLKEKGIKPAVVAGHSLGEYNAVLASGILDFPSVLRLVRRRAQLMEEASSKVDGGMAAVIGLERGKIISTCKNIEEVVEAVNFNSPSQIVISGEKKGIEKAAKHLIKEGAKRVIPLPVSGPFHTSLIKEAGDKFSSELNKLNFSIPQCKIITNAFASYVFTPEEAKRALKQQMNHPVLWEDSMKKLILDGIDLFIEVGPGSVLQNLLRRIDKKANTSGVETPSDIERLEKLLKA
ncbi:MAG: ACP S-malonyltransferase [Candidatus Aerophobetes bacterium]|nr:ACP S-malonyltransferase [Candidatus Aerophobetes bacterium]